MIDFRYYIIMIITIFISLGIGILIGGTIGGNELAVDQQQHLINDLENRLLELSEQKQIDQGKIEKLESQLAEKAEFQKKIFPLVIEDKLEGSSLLVIKGEELKKSKEKQLIEILQLAGVSQFQMVADNLEGSFQFEHVLFLGETNTSLKNRIEGAQEVVTVQSEELNQVTRLTEVILDLAAVDKDQLGSVNFETKSVSSHSGLQ